MKRLSCTTYDAFMREFSIDAPSTFNFAFDVVDVIATESPERIAVVHVDDAGVRRDYTFGWLAEESSRIASALKAQGLGKGDTVMLVLHRRIEFWVTMLALHKLGAVAIPSPALLTPKDIVFRVQRANVRAVIVSDDIVDRMEECRAQCPSLQLLVHCGGVDVPAGWHSYDALRVEGASSFPRPVGAELACGDDALLIFFSSGTTGMPKMVKHVHTYPLGHIITGTYWHDLRPGDLHLTLADTGWGKALWGKFYGQWMAGATVLVYDFRGKFEPEALLDVMATHRVTTFCAPPTVYRFLVRADLAAYNLSSLRHCTTAGELLNESVYYAWEKATGLPIREGYGQTETTLQVATLPFMEAKPGSIGCPMPGWGIVLLDSAGQPCPTGEEGEICIDVSQGYPIGLFHGYVGDEEKTASVIFDGYYHTGDKAWQDEDGYLWFLGRVDDLIKSSGYRIGPFEVESTLVAHPAVVESAVTGVPDALRGQAVKATIVLAPGYEPTDALTLELQNHVKRLTAPYKYPRIVEYVAELPKTISGKIKRAEIRQRDNEQASNA